MNSLARFINLEKKFYVSDFMVLKHFPTRNKLYLLRDKDKLALYAGLTSFSNRFICYRGIMDIKLWEKNASV